jgi:hypothetical protein
VGEVIPFRSQGRGLRIRGLELVIRRNQCVTYHPLDEKLCLEQSKILLTQILPHMYILNPYKHSWTFSGNGLVVAWSGNGAVLKGFKSCFFSLPK